MARTFLDYDSEIVFHKHMIRNFVTTFWIAPLMLSPPPPLPDSEEGLTEILEIQDIITVAQ